MSTRFNVSFTRADGTQVTIALSARDAAAAAEAVELSNPVKDGTEIKVEVA